MGDSHSLSISFESLGSSVVYLDALLIDEALEFILLLCIMAVIGIVMFIIFQQYHSKYNKLDDDMDLEWAIRFDAGTLKVVPLHQEKESESAQPKKVEN